MDALKDFERRPDPQQTRANFHADMIRANARRVCLQTATGELGFDANAAIKKKEEDKENSPPTDDRSKPRRKLPDWKYCWSCGVNFGRIAHTSNTCRNKVPGHKKTATFRNVMGGNNLIAFCPNEKADPLFEHLVVEKE